MSIGAVQIRITDCLAKLVDRSSKSTEYIRDTSERTKATDLTSSAVVYGWIENAFVNDAAGNLTRLAVTYGRRPVRQAHSTIAPFRPKTRSSRYISFASAGTGGTPPPSNRREGVAQSYLSSGLLGRRALEGRGLEPVTRGVTGTPAPARDRPRLPSQSRGQSWSRTRTRSECRMRRPRV